MAISVYPIQDTDHVKATTCNNLSIYAPWFATDPAKSLTGLADGTSFISNAATNQRFHIDLGSERVIKQIYYENFHGAGTSTNFGAQNFTIWGSNSAAAFAELTFAIDTDWTQITPAASVFIQHASDDVAEPRYIALTNTVAYRYYAFKFADNFGGAYISVRRLELQVDQGIAGKVTLPLLQTAGSLVNPYRFVSSSLTLPLAKIVGSITNPSRWITGTLSLPSLQVSAAMQKFPVIRGTLSLPLLRSYATLSEMVYVTGDLTKNAISAVTVIAEGSGEFNQSIPGLTISASATQHPIAKLTEDIPPIELIASALQEHIGTLLASIPGITLSAEAHEDGVASLTSSIPAIQLTASAIAGVIGTLEKAIGAISLSASGYFLGSNSAVLSIPAIILNAEASVSDAEFIALALNTKNFGLSKYTSYGYNSLCVFNGEIVGAKSDGIYELSGTSDKAGKVISWKLRTGKLLMHKARLREVYLYGKLSGDLIMTVETAEGARYEYDVEPISENEDFAKVKVGKGLSSEYLTIELTNEFGETIQIDKIQGFGMKLS